MIGGIVLDNLSDSIQSIGHTQDKYRQSSDIKNFMNFHSVNASEGRTKLHTVTIQTPIVEGEVASL